MSKKQNSNKGLTLESELSQILEPIYIEELSFYDDSSPLAERHKKALEVYSKAIRKICRLVEKHQKIENRLNMQNDYLKLRLNRLITTHNLEVDTETDYLENEKIIKEMLLGCKPNLEHSAKTH